MIWQQMMDPVEEGSKREELVMKKLAGSERQFRYGIDIALGPIG